MAGYGRGYYGSGQLAQSAPRRKSWLTIAAVLGAGAGVVWLLWPRKGATAFGDGKDLGKDSLSNFDRPAPAPSTPITINVNAAPATAVPAVATGAFLKQIEDDARARGYISVKDYEDSVVATAKQLQATGAKVVLAPHQQHLASQLGPQVP